MKESEISYDTIQQWLDRVPCDVRLYPELIAALDILLDQNVSTEVHKRITSRISAHVPMGCTEQFNRDLRTYGLYEAILYFHTFPFTMEAADFIKGACDLYCEIAAQYVNHEAEIEASDDPRIHTRLSLLEFRGATHRHPTQFQGEPWKKPKSIQAPAAPPNNPTYARRLPINRDLLLAFTESEIDEPGNSADEAIEHLDARFTFSDFPGIQSVMSEIAKLLANLQIDPFSAAGQYVLQEIIEHMEEEFYGDFDRWVKCLKCHQDFMPQVTLSSANENLICGGWLCDDCREQTDMEGPLARS